MPPKARLAIPICLALLLALPALAAGDAHPDGLRPPLGEVLDASLPDSLVPVSIVLKEQVNRERIRLATAGLLPQESRRAVINLLKRTARGTQGPLLERLRLLEGPGQASRIRPLWIGNVIGVDATPDVIREIAARPEVDWVNHNPKVDVFLEDRLGGGPPDPSDLGPRPPADDPGVDAVECGTELMRAPEVWNDLGITGDGAVIAVIDTGVCWTHTDIANQIWVNPGEDLDGDGVVMDTDDENGADDDGNGFIDDLIGWDFDQNDNRPDDDNSHGSHVAGTVAGDGTSGTQAGMAPDAKVMVIRVGVTFADEVDVWNGMQYAADNGADSISMSLGWPHAQNPDRATWRTNSDNTIDAGTAMVIAAGNEGSGSEPDNVRTPGDVPRIISVGATDCNDNIASFSSRGPVSWEDVDPYNDHPYPPGLTKPDVSAPGVSTESHNFCSGYSFKSGTSMATPHVAGAVALMKSANPGLDHDTLKEVLENTSIDLGASGKDNVYGSGRVDVFEAVNAVFGLTIEDVTIVDDDPDYANGDGGADTGEIITMIVTLHNQRDDQSATNVRGSITSETSGVTLVHDYAEWPDVAPEGSEQSLAPNFSVRIDEDCNYRVDFLLTLEHDDRTTRQRFSIRVGSPIPRTLLADDFETDQGWTVSSTATTGAFVRDDPEEVRDSSRNIVQPDDDVTADPGALCWVTGNDDRNAGDDDVDGGITSVTSPVLDASDFDDATFHYWRWFHAVPTTLPASDFLRVQWSRDGVSWTNMEELTTSEPDWTEREFPTPFSALGPGLRLRVEVEDDPISPLNSIVEGLVDEVTIAGNRIECDPFTPPVVAAPNPVGDTLLLSFIAGDDVRLDWTEPPADAQHDPATLYRIYRSDQPDSGFAVDGLSTDPFHVEPGERSIPSTIYFLVVSENGGGTSGDEP